MTRRRLFMMQMAGLIGGATVLVVGIAVVLLTIGRWK